MGNNKDYEVESDFDDLHGNADDESIELDVDMTGDNPIIKAALSDEDWVPPKKDDEDGDEKDDDKDDEFEDEDEDEGDELDELDSEDEDEDESEEEDEDEDEDTKYSKKVQKRIDRERNRRKEENQTANRRIRKLEKKLELQDERSTFDSDEAKAQRELTALRKKKVEAKEEGDTEAEVEIDDQILDIKADRKAKKIALDQRIADIDNDDDDIDTSSNTPAEGQKFLKKYPQFYTNQAFKNVLLQVDKMVMSRGFDKNTKEYYLEMEKILKPQFPEIIKTAKVTKKRRKKPVKRGAVGSTTKAGTRGRKTRRGVVRLTKQDQANMLEFGLDPTNPTDAAEWAANKTS